jgi:hypothetical protein
MGLIPLKKSLVKVSKFDILSTNFCNFFSFPGQYKTVGGEYRKQPVIFNIDGLWEDSVHDATDEEGLVREDLQQKIYNQVECYKKLQYVSKGGQSGNNENICPTDRPTVRPSVRPSVHPSVCLAVCLPICLPICISVCYIFLIFVLAKPTPIVG